MKYYSKLLIFLLLTLQVLNAQQSVTSARVEFVFVSKDVDGTIEGFQSSSKIIPEELTSSVFEGSVAISTLKTGNFLRDWHLKSSKYFDEETYPTITFKSTEVTSNENGLEVIGTITIKGISKSITWYFQKEGKTLRGTSTLFSSDFNINIKKGRQENKVEINLILELG
ncbi:YceI family protein [uncultured Eudoraea sp.]|jgi:polyisoprenoid-binding protein YceI|uniref:YceI family protein n=1 Tax=uncultured Eudoraea sp. TaxID=1035614 RepID=UPI00260D56C5|nr:YceI family protein [uncultured Eudoraea sp.]